MGEEIKIYTGDTADDPDNTYIVDEDGNAVTVKFTKPTAENRTFIKHTHHTFFKNPLFKSFQLNCGGYGNIPARPFGTTDEFPEFLEYCQNAMNMNGEQSGFNKEVVSSLTFCRRDTVTKKPLFVRSIGLYPNDKSSFFIGLPTETDNTYQQGLTTLSPINFEINVSQDVGANTYANTTQTPPLICLLFDSSISILVQPNGMPPLVRLGNYDLTSRD
ncbi:hypothetical protein M9Y10_031294 [Tritrichomonas musculus]|uniref:Uncharacterized protein n=1 Tax=Tritrichomonas musculus TaxID=1915356 RepID=A0ABR2H1D3_9EUKA